jgi:hypothetical protein
MMTCGCSNFQKVGSFVYLGRVVNSDDGVLMEIEVRLGVANTCYFGLMKHLSKLLSRKINCLVYKILLRPYGLEACGMVKQGEKSSVL